MKRILALTVLIGELLHGASALAHARLAAAVPAEGSVVASAPAEVTLTFNEAVILIACKVVDAAGKEVAGPAKTDGPTVRVPLQGPLAAGRYTVNYRVAGPDGHAMNGALSFTVQAARP